MFFGFRLPVWSRGRLITARTCSLFVYGANIHGVDIIIGYPFLKVFNLQVDTANDRLVVVGSQDSKPQQPSSSVKATAASSTEKFSMAPSTRVISDNELRCLLFCKGDICSLDCCKAAQEHRLATLRVAGTEPLDVDCFSSDPPLDVEQVDSISTKVLDSTVTDFDAQISDFDWQGRALRASLSCPGP